MQVYQTDQNGFYVGPAAADPDPLDEGNWLVPGGCVVDEPPPLERGQRARFLGGVWTVVEPAEEPETDPEPEPDPDAERANMSLSFAQFMIGLVAEQWITEEEGRLWLTGTLPPQVVSTINLIPEEQRFAATAKATRPSVVGRMDPLVQRMALVQKRSDAEVDDFFRTYASA